MAYRSHRGLGALTETLGVCRLMGMAPYGDAVIEDDNNKRIAAVLEGSIIGQRIQGLEVDGYHVIVSLENGADLLFDLTEFGDFRVGLRRVT